MTPWPPPQEGGQGGCCWALTSGADASLKKRRTKKTGRNFPVTDPLSLAHPRKNTPFGRTPHSDDYGRKMQDFDRKIGVKGSPERRIFFPGARGRGGPSPGNFVVFCVFLVAKRLFLISRPSSTSPGALPWGVARGVKILKCHFFSLRSNDSGR